jgi:fibro-slime domain-containing protein
MFSRHSFLALASLASLTASLACSAQGDQTDTGLGNGGNGNGGAANGGGTLPVGGTGSGLGGSGGTIPVGGTSSGASGSGGTQGGIQCVGNGAGLRGVLRDFQPTWMGVMGHPDFEPQVTKPTAVNFFNMVERGIVQPRISDEVNRKPVYAGPATGTNTTIGQAYFPSWFQDTPGANVSIDYTLTFIESTTTPGLYVFDKAPFLPVDDGPNCPVMPQTPCLLGNSRNYNTHNYALTFEFHTKFVYKTGMSFLFSGDDDVWVFVNGALAIDLGGIHQKEGATLNLDSANPPLVVGQEYILDFFWAERHVTQSNFHIETSLDFINCSIDVPK